MQYNIIKELLGYSGLQSSLGPLLKKEKIIQLAEAMTSDLLANQGAAPAAAGIDHLASISGRLWS